MPEQERSRRSYSNTAWLGSRPLAHSNNDKRRTGSARARIRGRSEPLRAAGAGLSRLALMSASANDHRSSVRSPIQKGACQKDAGLIHFRLRGKMLAVQAERETVPDHAFGPNTKWQRELRAFLPFAKRPPDEGDHRREDRLEQPRPMDG